MCPCSTPPRPSAPFGCSQGGCARLEQTTVGAPIGRILSLRILSERILAERILVTTYPPTVSILSQTYPFVNVSSILTYPHRTYPPTDRILSPRSGRKSESTSSWWPTMSMPSSTFSTHLRTSICSWRLCCRGLWDSRIALLWLALWKRRLGRCSYRTGLLLELLVYWTDVDRPAQPQDFGQESAFVADGIMGQIWGNPGRMSID